MYTLIQRKGKTHIREAHGACVIIYQINTADNTCACGKTLCPHLEYYFVTCMGLEPRHLVTVTAPHIKSWLKETGDTKGLNAKCQEYLDTHECVICIGILGNGSLHQCPQCRNFFHGTCYRRCLACPICKWTRPTAPTPVCTDYPSL